MAVALKVSDERGIQDLPSGDPAPLLRTVTLPVNKVLPATALAAGIEQPPNSVGFRAIDKLGGA